MNFLVLQSKYQVDSSYVYQGANARELIKLHDLSVGTTQAAILYNHSQGQAVIEELSKDYLRISYQPNSIIFCKQPLTVIVGLCRPQSVKKVIQASVSLGIQKIVFIKAQNSERSYLDSHIWGEAQLEHEVALGMAQSGDYLAPEINVLKNIYDLKIFLSDLDPENKFQKYLASTESGTNHFPKLSSISNLILAIGPEKGWVDVEEQFFSEQGFQKISFGTRILRIESALIYGVAKII